MAKRIKRGSLERVLAVPLEPGPGQAYRPAEWCQCGRGPMRRKGILRRRWERCQHCQADSDRLLDAVIGGTLELFAAAQLAKMQARAESLERILYRVHEGER
jgi:hypothetical protein